MLHSKFAEVVLLRTLTSLQHCAQAPKNLNSGFAIFATASHEKSTPIVNLDLLWVACESRSIFAECVFFVATSTRATVQLRSPLVSLMNTSRFFHCLAAALAVTCAALNTSAEEKVDFARQVQPIFAEHCLECHGPDDAKGGLVLTSREAAMKALKSGAHAIIPGQPGKSAVMERLTTGDLDDRMPPKEKKPMKPGEIETLRRWITEGAEFQAHWAYRPLGHPQPPAVKNTAAIRNEIDQFVIAKLEASGLSPAPEASRSTLIRRVYLDLLGLPPTVEQVDAFIADGSPQAYGKMLDEAMTSEHFGERWGRHWLDMARYADSDGYEKDRPRPDAWRFRDWVIHAINDDMPFDQFTIEQLAGDLLPNATAEQNVATAFNRQTLTNTEGGTDQEQFRIEACMDRTETLGTVWLGLTVGCARCHTHKYDQISQKEYYQLFSFFNNGDEVVRQAPTSPAEWAAYEKINGTAARALIPLRKKLDEAKSSLPVKLPEWEKGIQARLAAARSAKATQQFTPLKIISTTSKGATTFAVQGDGSVIVGGKQLAQDTYTVTIELPTTPVSALQLEVLPDKSLPKNGPGRSSGGNFVLNEIQSRLVPANGPSTGIVLHTATADYEQKDFKADGTLDNKPSTGWAVGGKTGQRHILTLQLSEPLNAAPGSKLELRLDQLYAKSGGNHTIGRFRVLAATQEVENSIAPAAVLKILNEEPKRRNPVVIQALYEWMEKIDPDVRAAQAALNEAEAKLPKAPLMDVRVIAERAKEPRTTHVLHRGDFLQPAEEVVPATFGTLPALKVGDGKASRLDLARWLVSKENPLTPRVTVNQIWTHLFGEGLVTTTADFGVRGAAPTHPEMLDWLAARFVQDGWSRKSLLRLIMTSATYRQSSVPTTALGGQRSPNELALIENIDPRNLLLWRQNRLRVEGEIVRDLYLAASGLLSPKIGGPSVFPPMPSDVAALSYAGNFSWKTSVGEDRYRRGMYTFFKRTAPHPELMTFDCPDANLTNVRRTVSNTPLQALTTLNAEAFTEAAQALAASLLSDPTLRTDEAKLSAAIRRCVSRPPQRNELATMESLLLESRRYYQSAPQAEIKAMNGNALPKDASPTEHAAWTALTRIVLNLDEFITRE